MRRLALGMFLVGLIGTLSSCGGCNNPAPTKIAPRPVPKVVTCTDLVRDYWTATAYTDVRIRVVLNPRDGAVATTTGGTELRLWAGTRDAPPALVFRFETPPPGAGPLTVVGTARAPVRDGVWRSPRCDYVVVVDDCVVVLP